jgi:hypothetical protein
MKCRSREAWMSCRKPDVEAEVGVNWGWDRVNRFKGVLMS